MIVERPLNPTAFDPVRVLRALSDAGVEYVVVGGIAAVLHGAPVATVDLDAAVRRSEENLDRLAGALRTLGARVLVSIAADGSRATIVDQPVTAQTLDLLDPPRLLTDHGVLDVLWRDSAVGGYDEWAASAAEVDLGDVVVAVASVEDVVRSKEAAGRDKDRRMLPFLYALRDATGGSDRS